MHVTSVYVPNGRSLDNDHYQYKLRWLAQLRRHVAEIRHELRHIIRRRAPRSDRLMQPRLEPHTPTVDRHGRSRQIEQLDAHAPRASGTLEAHYAPRAPVRLMGADALREALAKQSLVGLAVYSRSVPLGAARGVRHRRMPARPDQAAHELFAVLRALDDEGVQLIWVEEPPPDPEWDGVRDRLLRAAAA